jgi:putative oxidoreductase
MNNFFTATDPGNPAQPSNHAKRKNMKTKFLAHAHSLAFLVARVLLGVVVFPHGAQKLLGWFGGFGFEGSMQYFTRTVGLPWILGFGVILLESFGALALIAGLGTRLLAGAYVLLALGITLTTRVQYGFFMNWFGNQPGEGYEYFLLWLGLAASLALTGGGQYALDAIISRKKAGVVAA